MTCWKTTDGRLAEIVAGLEEAIATGNWVRADIDEEEHLSIARELLAMRKIMAKASPDLKAAVKELETTSLALDQSVKLQSHYAGLLNQYDGGSRLQFDSAKDWIERLEEVRHGGE